MQDEIGFGRYQMELFLLSGFGWMADSKCAWPLFFPDRSRFKNFTIVDIWLQGVAIILPQVQQELNPKRVEYATLALYVGLIIGATTWGVLADLIGRKISWQITLFIAVRR